MVYNLSYTCFYLPREQYRIVCRQLGVDIGGKRRRAFPPTNWKAMNRGIQFHIESHSSLPLLRDRLKALQLQFTTATVMGITSLYFLQWVRYLKISEEVNSTLLWKYSHDYETWVSELILSRVYNLLNCQTTITNRYWHCNCNLYSVLDGVVIAYLTWKSSYCDITVIVRHMVSRTFFCKYWCLL